MPARPRLAPDSSSFPTWDEMAAEAAADAAGNHEPYQIPMGEDDVIVIERPDGERYMKIDRAQRIGDPTALLENLIPDDVDRERIKLKMRGTDMLMIDTLCGKVLRHFFGLSLETQRNTGNSAAS